MNSRIYALPKLLIFGGGLFFNVNVAMANEPAKPSSDMTVMKEWTADASINGKFEQDRRKWLASVRNKRYQDIALANEIHVENITDHNEVKNKGFPKELLENFVNKIKKEIKEP